MSESAKSENAGKRAKELNATIRYTMWSVFRLRDLLGEADRETEAAEVDAVLAKLAEIRGWSPEQADRLTTDAFFNLFDRIPRPAE